MSDPSPLHANLIGTQNLFNTIVSHIRHASWPATPPVDPVILQALLTSIIAGDCHLIIRTPEEDVGLVARLAVWTLSSVFDYTTHKLKIRRKSSSPNDTAFLSTPYFLRSLFLPGAFSSSASNFTSQDESSDANRPRGLRPRRSKNLHRPHTVPDIPFVSTTRPHIDRSALSEGPPPIGRHVKSSSHTGTGRNIYSGNKPLPQLPRALVITGLENASIASQRALAQVLVDGRILFDSGRDGRRQQSGQEDTDPESEGTYDFPDGFIVVYVCPMEPRERPNIHKSMLDKFAMSCNVAIKPNVRQALQSILLSPSVGRSGSGPHSNPSSPLANPHMPLPPTHTPPYGTRALPHHRQSHHAPHLPSHSRSYSHSTSQLPTIPSPIVRRDFIECLHQARAKTRLAPTLSIYLADLFSATQNHPQLDGTLLSARCRRDTERLARAACVLGIDPTGMELLRNEEDKDPDTDNEGDGETDDDWHDVADEYGTIGVPGSMRKSIGSTKAHGDNPTEESHEDPEQEDTQIPVLDVTEVNIARVFPRCVSHRLRIRDGPREEVLAGAVFGATFGDSNDDDAEESGAEDQYVDSYEVRPTVKDALVSIMSEV